MTLNQILSIFYKKKASWESFFKFGKFKVYNLNILVGLSSLVILSIIFFTISNILEQKSLENESNLKKNSWPDKSYLQDRK